MWDAEQRPVKVHMTDQEVNDKYDMREMRIVTESNREKLPNFVDALARPNYIDLRPFYQRRARWTAERQSALIESFIINIPVPPLFLYEKSYNSYEVMDGQQRITAIRAFYENQFKLTGLHLWPELNGKTYATLPTKIRAGIDRRSIAYIVLLKESAESDEEALHLKQLVFERLNTGGIRLGNQEIRNSLYQGPLNTLLIELSRHALFTKAWEIPAFSEQEKVQIPQDLADNTLYKDMGDAEIILRFLALRHAEHFRNGMQGFLDLYMIRGRAFGDDDIAVLRRLFEDTIELAAAIYGDLLFRPYDPASGWAPRAHKAFYDAVMVGLSRHLDQRDELLTAKAKVVEATRELFVAHPTGTFTGRANTKNDIVDRIALFDGMLTAVLGQ